MNSSGSTCGRSGNLHCGFESLDSTGKRNMGIKVASIPNLYGKLEDGSRTRRWDNIFLALNTKGAGIDLRDFTFSSLHLNFDLERSYTYKTNERKPYIS